MNRAVAGLLALLAAACIDEGGREPDREIVGGDGDAAVLDAERPDARAQPSDSDADAGGPPDSASCDERPACPPDRLQSEVPCGDREPDCRPVEACGVAAYCRLDDPRPCAAVACEAGEAASIDRPCLPYEIRCRRLVTCDGAGLFCRNDGGCDEEPGATDQPRCDPGLIGDPEVPCGRGERTCKTIELCGNYTFCRPDEDCVEAPRCPEGSVGTSRFACGYDEDTCTAEYGCGTALFCRLGPVCDAAPSCERGYPTPVPCVRREPFCERVTVCAETVFCRW